MFTTATLSDCMFKRSEILPDRSDYYPLHSFILQGRCGSHPFICIGKSNLSGLQQSLEMQQVAMSDLVSLWLLLHMQTFFPCNERS